MMATLAELRQAYADGRLSAGTPLMLDNDQTSVYDDDGLVFEMHPGQLLEECLDALGVPHEEV